ncbi:uncharacterized protein Bfra_005907 [Botrytis fragariae]|uniref:Zinc-binding loop region of homing endonuclease domain-containing protein n=1 Tax=Botrytis fragariae TaxID=1964551 RepID=A0A8H6ARN3_9HELO|nr:uncharacterized protein Bfra_005907 [Botrytis fragariae]KAF5872546.1 hypothetical protein Bfra_005907 [Botrytis fragariae]
MTNPNESASKPLAQRAVSEQPAQEAPQLTVENVAGLGFDNELIRFAVFHTSGSIWEAADVLLRFESQPYKGDAVGLLEFALWIAENDQIKASKILARSRSGTPARSNVQKTAASIRSVEKSNNETTQKQSTLEEVVDGGKSQSKEMAESAQGASTIANAIEEAKATLPSNKSASIVRSGEAPTSSWSPGLQSHQSKSRQLASSWKHDFRSAARLSAQKTTMTERQHFRMSNNIQDNKIQKATDPTDRKGKMVATAIQTETIIATPTVSSHTQSKAFTAAMKKEVIGVRIATSDPKKSAYGSGIKRKLEIVEISDDDGDGDGAADVNRHDLVHLKEGNNATENIAAEDASAKGDLTDDSLTAEDSYVNIYDSTDEQEPNFSPLVNEGVWRSKKIAWVDELFQKSKSHIRVSGYSSPPHHAKCFKRGLQEKKTLGIIRKSFLELESKAFPDPKKCILEGAVASATIELKYGCSHCLMNHKWLLILDENHMPPKEGLLALEAKYISDGSYLTKNKLCGNEACRRPSHIVGESKEFLTSRRICQGSREGILRNGHVSEDKCVSGGGHYPECMGDLTLSDEASYRAYRACKAHNWKGWHQWSVIKVKCGKKFEKKTRKYDS